MALVVAAEPVPLREDETGSIRIGSTRVLLEIVLHAYEDGATPEDIVRRYSTLSLDDVYAVITWYLRHKPEAVAYLERRDREAAEVRTRIDAHQGDLSELRERIQNARKRGSGDADSAE
jgi:uncharacterized protein (DUF433 family)